MIADMFSIIYLFYLSSITCITVRAWFEAQNTSKKSKTWYSTHQLLHNEQRISESACSKGFWQCSNGYCIQYGFICDNENHCGDWSDESPDICKICEDPTHFPCADKQLCISIDLVCNGEVDCHDESDEDRSRCERKMKVKLLRGDNDYSGVVIIRQNGIWGTITDESWNDNNARVICRMLNYGEGTSYKVDFEDLKTKPSWNIRFNCQGTETSLECCLNIQNHIEFSENVCEAPRYAGVSCSPSSKHVCGSRFFDSKDMKVVGGRDAFYGEFPWQVRILVKHLNIHLCGATIIDEFHVISAAHCYDSYHFQPFHYILRVGDFNEVLNEEEEDFEIENIIPHEKYDGRIDYYDYDIVIMKIRDKNGRGIRYGKYVQPACLIEQEAPLPVGMMCLVSGWGDTGGNTLPEVLQAAAVKILSDEFCRNPNVYYYHATDNMFCAGYVEGGIDSCQGDSGGPLVCKFEDKYTLTGIVSWGNNCSLPGFPGIYTRISNLRQWIDDQLKL